jgi:hypothetical protein
VAASSRIGFGCFGVLTMLLWVTPPHAFAQSLAIDCNSGATIRGALANMKAGDTLTVTGTCRESVAIEAEVARITLDGRGTASIQSPSTTQNAIAIRGREITVRGFTIGGGTNGIVIQRGATATIDGNVIRGSATSVTSTCQCSSGILVGPESSAVIINNTIENNRYGISVDENSSARVGFQVPTTLGLPNTIQNNTDVGIAVLHNSSARIIGATIRNNGGPGIQVERTSHADISDNTISGNVGNGITVSGNSAVDLDLGRIQEVAQPNKTTAGSNNGGFGVACSLGAYVSGSLGMLMGAKGAMYADSTCMHGLETLVGTITLAPLTVAPGGTFTATFSGTGLSSQTYFDIRFRTPGSNTDQEVLNWQQGPSGVHSVSLSTPAGTYAITAIRAHADAADHIGSYIPVAASLRVQP